MASETWRVVLASGEVLSVECLYIGTVALAKVYGLRAEGVAVSGQGDNFVEAILDLARDGRLRVAEILAPGEPTRAELAAQLAATLETRTAEHALAMERVRELEAIIAGRTTPPTDAEMRAHDVAGGSWLVWWGRESYTIAPAWLPYRRPGYGLKPWDLAQRWIALDAEGRPCAWPTAEVSRG